MSTAQQVENAWVDKVLTHRDITSYTDKIYTYDVTEGSELEISNLYSDGEINFIQCLVGRGQKYAGSQSVSGRVITYNYLVEVTYFRQADPQGNNWKEVRNFFDDLFSTVLNELGITWDATVDYFNPQLETPEITQERFDNSDTWRGFYRFFGTKTVSI